MRRRIVFFCFSLCILLSACISQASPTIHVKEETFTSTVLGVLPTPSYLAEAETTLPPNPTPTVLQPSGIISPVFIFLKNDTLMMQVGAISSESVDILADLGEIKDALIADETVYLICENGIQQINLTDGSNDILLHFNAFIESGKMFWDANHSRIFYNGINYDIRDSLIGYIDLERDTVNPVFSYTNPLVALFIIGLTEDGQGLYCLPHGQDPDFDKMLLVNINQGAISRELPVRGYNYAVLSPDSRHLATSAQVIDASGQLENMINIYDLPSLPLTSPKIFKLPIPASMIGNNGFYWSPDGKGLYFMLVENKEDPSTSISDGMWVLDVEIGSMHKVVDIPDPNLQMSGVSPDGTLLLVRSATNDEAFLVDSQTGEIDSFYVPLDAILVGWQ